MCANPHFKRFTRRSHSGDSESAGLIPGLDHFLADSHRHTPNRRTGRQIDQQSNSDGIDACLVVETTHHNTVGQIAKAAEEGKADVIVCGSRGFGVVAGAVAGSVAMRLPHVASCPVVIVSEKAMERAALAAR